METLVGLLIVAIGFIVGITATYFLPISFYTSLMVSISVFIIGGLLWGFIIESPDVD